MPNDFGKDKVFWTKGMNLALAKYMEDKPFIWDTKHPKFSNVGLRDETFANFANQYEGLNWPAVKERWTNIRSTYGFYMRKIKSRKAAGQDFKVNWFMWHPCKYLYKVHRTKDEIKKERNSNKEEENDEMDNDNDNTQYSNSDDEYLSTSAQPKTNATCDDIVQNICNVFEDVQDNRFTTDTSQYAQVGLAVTKKLSQLNSYDAARLSQKILEILAEYDENNPMNPNNA